MDIICCVYNWGIWYVVHILYIERRAHSFGYSNIIIKFYLLYLSLVLFMVSEPLFVHCKFISLWFSFCFSTWENLWDIYIFGIFSKNPFMEKTEIAYVKFSGKNYFAWEFQFQIYIQGKELWGHIDGNTSKPTDPTKAAKWKSKRLKLRVCYCRLWNLLLLCLFVTL